MSNFLLFAFVLGFTAHALPSDTERAKDSARFRPIVDLKKIEFVAQGIPVKENLEKYLTVDMAAKVSSMRLTWLQVRDASIDRSKIVNNANGVKIPLVVGVRYQYTKNIVDGTLNLMMHVHRAEDGSTQVTVIEIDDNQAIQGIGRAFSSFNWLEFLQTIGVQTVQSHLNQPGNLEEFIQLR